MATRMGPETVALVKDGFARIAGRILYRVSVDGTFIGSVARWEGERRWTIAAKWYPDRGRDEQKETFPSRKAAIDDLLWSARDLAASPLATQEGG